MTLSAEQADSVLVGEVEVSCCMRCGEMFTVSAKQRIRNKGKLKSIPLCDIHMPGTLVPGDTLKITYEFEVS